MDAIDLLITRASNGKLQDPAPDDASLQRAFEAAARVPDHGTLRPLRVLAVRGSARERLGDLMADVLIRKRPDSTADDVDKMRKKALRAPLVLVVCAVLKAGHKVPEIEQVLSAGAGAHALLLALHAQGYAAIWRTGDAAYDDAVKHAFGVASSDAIVGFIYAGTAKQPAPELARPSTESFVSEWHGPAR